MEQGRSETTTGMVVASYQKVVSLILLSRIKPTTAATLLYFSHLSVKNITKAFDFSYAEIKGFVLKPA